MIIIKIFAENESVYIGSFFFLAIDKLYWAKPSPTMKNKKVLGINLTLKKSSSLPPSTSFNDTNFLLKINTDVSRYGRKLAFNDFGLVCKCYGILICDAFDGNCKRINLLIQIGFIFFARRMSSSSFQIKMVFVSKKMPSLTSFLEFLKPKLKDEEIFTQSLLRNDKEALEKNKNDLSVVIPNTINLDPNCPLSSKKPKINIIYYVKLLVLFFFFSKISKIESERNPKMCLVVKNPDKTHKQNKIAKKRGNALPVLILFLLCFSSKSCTAFHLGE